MEPNPALRVLVVEDNHDTCLSLSLLLGVDGHAVRVALDGPSGVKSAREWEPDAVLLDIGLPGCDGYEVAMQVRALTPARRPFIVAVTGYGTAEDRRRSAEAGVDLHLVKPADPQAILDLLKRLRGARPG